MKRIPFILILFLTFSIGWAQKSYGLGGQVKCPACGFVFQNNNEGQVITCSACGYKFVTENQNSSNEEFNGNEGNGNNDEVNNSDDVNENPNTNENIQQKNRKQNLRKSIENLLIGATIKTVADSMSQKTHNNGRVATDRDFKQNDKFSNIENETNDDKSNHESTGDGVIVCPKCGYSADFFPYADSKKTTIRCPKCGNKIKIK